MSLKFSANKYTRNRKNSIRAFDNNDFDKFILNGRRSLESFLSFFVYNSFRNDRKKANDILNGKYNFQREKLNNQGKLSRPKGRKLIGLIYDNLYVEQLKTNISKDRFIRLYNELSKIIHDNVFSREHDVFEIKKELDIIDKVFNLLYLNEDNEKLLNKSLKLCNVAAKEGYKSAMKYLDVIEDSIGEANRILSISIKDLSKQKIKDISTLRLLMDQLEAVQKGFKDELDKTIEMIRVKQTQTAKFNITLFGRTKSGKSTLMEILIKGDGKSIGKGGQRTTKDIRQYDWKGMTVTDIPGIEAFEGKNDDYIASYSANFADLILFLITSGQPEKEEANWLVALKKKDKPLLCICNIKRTLDGFWLEQFIENYKDIFADEDLYDTIDQFKEFIKESLPNENVDFKVTHLLARYYAGLPEYASKKKELIQASKFEDIESYIINQIIENGIFYRQKCFLAIVDNPLFNQFTELFKFSKNSYNEYLTVYEKFTSFKNWQKIFNKNEPIKMEAEIENLFIGIKRKIPAFVDDNLENIDFNNHFKEFIKQQNIEKKIDSIIKKRYNECSEKIKTFFNDLDQEINFVRKFDFENQYGASIIDWKKTFGWWGALAGVGSVIGFLLLQSNPVGWALTATGLLFGLFKSFSKSKDEKKTKEKVKKEKEIIDSLEKLQKTAIKQSRDDFVKIIINQIQTDAYKRFKIVQNSLLALANSQRTLALKYSQNHIEVSKQMIYFILKGMNISTSKISLVARVPGKKTVIISDDPKLNNSNLRTEIGYKIGNGECVQVFPLNTDKPLLVQLNYLLKNFKIETSRPYLKEVNNNGVIQNVIYIKPIQLTDEIKDGISLIQQILQVHIIFKNYQNEDVHN